MQDVKENKQQDNSKSLLTTFNTLSANNTNSSVVSIMIDPKIRRQQFINDWKLMVTPEYIIDVNMTWQLCGKGDTFPENVLDELAKKYKLTPDEQFVGYVSITEILNRATLGSTEIWCPFKHESYLYASGTNGRLFRDEVKYVVFDFVSKFWNNVKYASEFCGGIYVSNV